MEQRGKCEFRHFKTPANAVADESKPGFLAGNSNINEQDMKQEVNAILDIEKGELFKQLKADIISLEEYKKEVEKLERFYQV